MHPEDRNKIIDEASKVFVEKRKDIFLEIRLNIDLKGNEICWVAERGEVFYNELGAPVMIIGTIVDITDQKRIEEELKEQKKSLETIIGINRAISSELNLENIVQYVTDAATKISGAEFGTFFYNTIGENEEELTLYTISGVPKEAFSKFPNLRKTQIVAPTFNGEQVMRVDDITQDPRYGKKHPIMECLQGAFPWLVTWLYL